MKKTLYLYAGMTVVLVFFLNLFAHFFYWYVSIPWYDMLMHTLGGIFLALWCGALWSRNVSHMSTKKSFAFIIGFVIVVGLGWEVFEYIVQGIIKGVQIADIPDSASDLICDTVGGIIGFSFVKRVHARYNSQ